MMLIAWWLLMLYLLQMTFTNIHISTTFKDSVRLNVFSKSIKVGAKM